ncbi:metabotropic glutamate receptor 2 [Caerostris extrusa]|uniref:Metabotropic glutamate receptor 2 n=1 Tax=Caerostris extrusa TaxID=172846 RepID=A0AAV4NC40_CAEEX|nr:metabotropic glutamate receptor 2 [Caerostris extrusa]
MGKGRNGDERCGPILPEKGIQRLEAMLYAIDQINKNLSYWKFSMDATILDTLFLILMLYNNLCNFLHYSCGPNANISRKVVAVVGASNSVVSASVANIFRLFQASKGEYGENAVQILKDLVRETSHEGICFATVEVLPRNAADQHYDAVVRRLSLNDKAKVVVVFLNEDKISDIPIDADFDNYFKSLKPFSNTRNPWFKEFWEDQFKCVFKKTTSAERRKLCTGTEDLSTSYQQEGLVPMVSDSVQLLATAIKTLCEEEPKFCKDPEKIDTKYRNSLIEKIGNTTLQSSQGHNMVISFDKTRSVPVNYTIFQYQKSQDKYSYKLIGEWNPSDRLKLQDEPVWSASVTNDLGRPLSTCSERMCSWARTHSQYGIQQTVLLDMQTL